jgi:alpha-L-rhamnosidase
MILAQIEEWFHAGLAGIRAADGTVAYRELVIQPKVVGDLTFVKGSYRTPQGEARSEWRRDGDRVRLTVTVPPNSTAEVWAPTLGGKAPRTPHRATFLRIDGGYAVYRVPSGTYTW